MRYDNSSVYLKDLRAVFHDTVNVEKLRGKCVLVTGATGTIGSFIVDALLLFNKEKRLDIRVLAAGRSILRLRERFGDKEGLVCLEYDLMQPICFDESVDYIIHAAGNAFPAAFNTDPVGTIMGNLQGTYALLEYGRNHGMTRFVYVSSGEVYGQGDLSLDAFEETYSGYVDNMLPRSCYPGSKRMAENLCVSYASQYDTDAVIVRPCHTYGPGITAKDNRAHVQFIRNALKNEDIILKSAGSQMRSYCYAGDCASAILSVLLNGDNKTAYNIANRNARITIAGLAKTIAACAGREVVFEMPNLDDIRDATPIAKQVLDSKRLESLGWQGRYDVEIGIKHTLEIIREAF